MIAEAIDTMITLGWAFAAWLIITSFAVAVALHTVIAAVWWTARTVWRPCAWLCGRLTAVEPPGGESSGPETPQRRTGRHTPAWTHTQPLDYEEAA